jgi:hypothetical protein
MTVRNRLRREACARRAAVCCGLADLLEGILRDAAVRERIDARYAFGLGPYKVGRFEVNRFIEFERVKDWWGADPAGLRVATTITTSFATSFYRDRGRCL